MIDKTEMHVGIDDDPRYQKTDDKDDGALNPAHITRSFWLLSRFLPA